MQMSDHWKVILKKKNNWEWHKKGKKIEWNKVFSKWFYIHPAKSDEVFKKK